MLRSVRSVTVRAMLVSACGLGLTAATALAIDYPEVEVNNNKANADTIGAFELSSGDSVSGATTGTSTVTAGNGSADYFRIRTAPQPLGIYRRQLTLTSIGPAGYALSLRGRNQVNNVISTLDVAMQTASNIAVPNRSVIWYGFGKQEEMYFRVTGSLTTTGTYRVTLNDAPVSPIIASGTLYEGPITFQTTLYTTGGSTDMEMWVYDANLNPIVDAGADLALPGATGTLDGRLVRCGFVRTLGPGTYTLAIGESNLANHLASPAGDLGSGSVFDFPGSVASSVVNRTTQNTNILYITDHVGNAPITQSLDFLTAMVGPVYFVQFTVLPNPQPSGLCESIPDAIGQGSAADLRVVVSPAAGGSLDDILSVTADVSQLTGDPADAAVSFSRVGATSNWERAVLATGPIGLHSWSFQVLDVRGGSGGGSGCPLRITPINDRCQAPIVLLPEVPFDGDNSGATNVADGPSTPCNASNGKCVWFSFTPAGNATFDINTCGTTRDTTLAIFTSPDCTDFTRIACNDDSVFSGPLCVPYGLASRINPIDLAAGTRYLFRVCDIGSAGVGGPYTVRATPLVTDGACCCGGTCLVAQATSCVSANQVFRGVGVACNPPGNATAPCCRADYNQSGAVSVQDIFDFLGGYFRANACADVNGSGLAPTVQDIFDFLASYFLGCL